MALDERDVLVVTCNARSSAGTGRRMRAERSGKNEAFREIRSLMMSVLTIQSALGHQHG